MSNIDRSDYYNIKFQKKPLMAWIWISVIMIVVGGSIRLFSNAFKLRLQFLSKFDFKDVRNLSKRRGTRTSVYHTIKGDY